MSGVSQGTEALAEAGFKKLLTSMSEKTFAEMAPKLLASMSEKQLAKMPAELIEKLSPAVLEKLGPKVLARMPETVLMKLSPEMLEQAIKAGAKKPLTTVATTAVKDFTLASGKIGIDLTAHAIKTLPVVKTTLFAVGGYAAYEGITLVGMGADRLEQLFGKDSSNPPSPPEGSSVVEFEDGTKTIVRPAQPGDETRTDGIKLTVDGKEQTMYPWNPDVDGFEKGMLDPVVTWIAGWSKDYPLMAQLALGALTFLGVQGVGGAVLGEKNSWIATVAGLGLAVWAGYKGVDMINQRADVIAEHDAGISKRYNTASEGATAPAVKETTPVEKPLPTATAPAPT